MHNLNVEIILDNVKDELNDRKAMCCYIYCGL